MPDSSMLKFEDGMDGNVSAISVVSAIDQNSQGKAHLNEILC